MPVSPNPHILHLAPYVAGKSSTGKPTQKVIKLSSNESPTGPSPKVREALQHAFATLHRYPNPGIAALREAIGALHNIEAAQIICGNGSDEILSLIMHCFAGPGDEIIHTEHGFLMYKVYANAFGITPVVAPEKNLTVDVDAILERVSAKTKIIFIANPGNPTGSMIPESEIRRLRNGLRDDILLVLDAAYAETCTDAAYESGINIARETDNTITTRTFSKTYALPSVRLGWGYAHPGIIDALGRVRSPFNVNSLAQVAGLAAIQDQNYLDKAIAYNSRMQQELSPTFEALGITAYPSHTNFILLGFQGDGPHTAQSVNQFLLERGIILRETGNYGLPHCLRMTIGTEEEHSALFAALNELMA